MCWQSKEPMYKHYNPNPYHKVVGDCVIRGISKLTNAKWDEVYTAICLQGFDMKDMPSSNNVWASYLVSKGYKRMLLPDQCPACYTVRDFCEDFSEGLYLVCTGSHVVAVLDGDYYDAWNSGDEIPSYYWTK